MKNWLKENWLFLIIIGIILFLAFILPFFNRYPAKDEYENWKRNATDQEIEDLYYEGRTRGSGIYEY